MKICIVTGLVATLFGAPTLAAGGNKISCEAAGPQAPRDITRVLGENSISFPVAPPAADMKLCDIHFHRNAEHRASGYNSIAGEGDNRGYVCSGATPLPPRHADGHGDAQGCAGIATGDTVEVHWVFTSCDVAPAPGLGSCFTETCQDPQLRVEARVFNLTDDGSGANFAKFSTRSSDKIVLPAPVNPVQYLGSTTGSGYNDGTCSPFKVTWNVSSACTPLEISSLNTWCGKNPFEEDHAHGVREVVEDPSLLSPISQ